MQTPRLASRIIRDGLTSVDGTPDPLILTLPYDLKRIKLQSIDHMAEAVFDEELKKGCVLNPRTLPTVLPQFSPTFFEYQLPASYISSALKEQQWMSAALSAIFYSAGCQIGVLAISARQAVIKKTLDAAKRDGRFSQQVKILESLSAVGGENMMTLRIIISAGGKSTLVPAIVHVAMDSRGKMSKDPMVFGPPKDASDSDVSNLASHLLRPVLYFNSRREIQSRN